MSVLIGLTAARKARKSAMLSMGSVFPSSTRVRRLRVLFGMGSLTADNAVTCSVFVSGAR